MTELALYQPAISLPQGITAFVTTRHGGHSRGPWQSFNLAEHVHDDPAAVAANRALLKTQLLDVTGCAALDVQWLNQVHGTTVHAAVAAGSQASPHAPPQADALYTRASGLVCGVLTADCLPVLFSSVDGKEIAVAHAGWRGLQKGILENTVAAFNTPAAEVMAWLGPAIGPCHFEVGNEVRQAFLAVATPAIARAIEAAFKPSATPGKWFADLYQLARIRLQASGMTQISGEPACTFCNSHTWYSYRHHPQTGRFATLIVKTA